MVDIIEAKKAIKKRYPTGVISDHYFVINGKYYTAITFQKIPEDVKMHFPDMSFLGVSIDINSGEIDDFSSFQLYEVCQPYRLEVKTW